MLSLHEHMICDHPRTLMSNGSEVCSQCGECIGIQWAFDSNHPNIIRIQSGVLNRYEYKTIRYTSQIVANRRTRMVAALTFKIAKHLELPQPVIDDAIPIINKTNFKGQVLEYGICAVLYCFAKAHNVPLIIEDLVMYFETNQIPKMRKRDKDTTFISRSIYKHIRSVFRLCPKSGNDYVYNLISRFGEGYLTQLEKDIAFRVVQSETVLNVQSVICAVFAVYIKGKKGQGIKERFYEKHARYVSATTIRNKRKTYTLEGLV